MLKSLRSLKLSSVGKQQVEHALTKRAWGAQNLAEESQVSEATAKNFRAGKSVDRKNFVIFCKVLDLDWEEAAGIRQISDSVDTAAMLSETSPNLDANSTSVEASDPEADLNFHELLELGAQNRTDSSQGFALLKNFLEPFEPFVQEMTTRLTDTQWVAKLFKSQANSRTDLVNPVLSVIRSTSQADVVFVLKQEESSSSRRSLEWLIAGYSDIEGQLSQAAYLEQIKTQILPVVSEKALFSPYHHGITLNNDQRSFILIPLQPDLAQKKPLKQFMIVCHPKRETPPLNEIYGHILAVFYQGCQVILPKAFPIEVATALIEATVLDGLKQAFGFVSENLYNRRFDLFRTRLQQMVVYFEPILELDQLQIFGWEALARDPFSGAGKSDKLVAPVDLFKSAELWGTEFTTELDLHFLRCATQTYLEKRQAIQLNRLSDLRPLSVNVYPATLMRTVYRETLKAIIKEERLIDGANLTLEISEKTDLPEPEAKSYSEPYWTEYRRQLKQHIKEFRVRFAIDDFGVGYASVSRLAGLRPTYVKIDREILLASSIEALRLTIDYVNELLLEVGSGSVIIIEGVEGQSPFDLKTLREIGVNYIQGHLVGKASADIQQRLRREEYEFFKELIEEG